MRAGTPVSSLGNSIKLAGPKPPPNGNRLVVPGNAEQVEGVDVPQPNPFFSFSTTPVESGWVTLLFKCRDNNIAFAGTLYGSFERFRVNC
jgi:hypothetical protein